MGDVGTERADERRLPLVVVYVRVGLVVDEQLRHLVQAAATGKEEPVTLNFTLRLNLILNKKLMYCI